MRSAAHDVAAQAEFDAARVAAARGIRQRREIGRAIGDMDAIEQAMASSRATGRAEQGFRRRRNELHGAVAADAARSRRSCCAPAGDSGLPRHRAATRWCAPATPAPNGEAGCIEGRRGDAGRHQDAAQRGVRLRRPAAR